MKVEDGFPFQFGRFWDSSHSFSVVKIEQVTHGCESLSHRIYNKRFTLTGPFSFFPPLHAVAS